MDLKALTVWFSVVSAILVFFGLLYMCLGLGILPIERTTLPNWESALYGSVLAGWGVTLFLVGKIALEKDNRELKQALFTGLAVWLIAEAIFSAKLGVWFNVIVDAGVLALFAVPLLIKPKTKGKK